jgi:hypothetical protein
MVLKIRLIAAILVEHNPRIPTNTRFYTNSLSYFTGNNFLFESDFKNILLPGDREEAILDY